MVKPRIEKTREEIIEQFQLKSIRFNLDNERLKQITDHFIEKDYYNASFSCDPEFLFLNKGFGIDFNMDDFFIQNIFKILRREVDYIFVAFGINEKTKEEMLGNTVPGVIIPLNIRWLQAMDLIEMISPNVLCYPHALYSLYKADVLCKVLLHLDRRQALQITRNQELVQIAKTIFEKNVTSVIRSVIYGNKGGYELKLYSGVRLISTVIVVNVV